MRASIRIRECAKWLWHASEGFRLSVVGCISTGVLHVGVSLFFVYVCKHLIDIATGPSDDGLSTYTGWLACSLTAQLLLSAARARLAARTEISLRNELHRRLFIHLMESRWSGREALHTGDLLNRLEEDVATVTDALSRTVPAVFITVFQLGGALFFLARLDVRLAGILVFIMPVALLFSKSYMRRMRRMSHEIRDTDSAIQSHMQEHLQHRILIRTLEYTEQAIARLTELQSNLQERVMRRTDFSIFSRAMVQAGFMAGYAAALLWGVFGLRDGSVTFGMMAAFLQLVAQIQRPMVDLSRHIPAFVRVFTAAERLAELTFLQLEEHGTRQRLSHTPGIRIEHLSYTYPGSSRIVLDDFSHDFPPGSMTAVIGETGAGKSTLIRLILALLQPDKGSIRFYDATREAGASPLTRCNLSYVPQDNTLMSGTIRDNLRMGNPQATEEQMETALHSAAADFVLSLPDGLNTRCGEQGAGLSEGQAQRIAIARGLLRPGGILLLDEPTSALDEPTEQMLLQRLALRLHGKTLILVTHRDTVARFCNSVIRIRKSDRTR